MPFVLREDGATDNPPLATVYGLQITDGKLAYYIKEGRTRCIIILGEGEMDGVEKLYYNGEILPEFASNNPSDRNWRFHPGTITTQPANFYDVTAVGTDSLTLASNPFSASNNITENITATGGTRTLSYLGNTTTALAYNASAATIQAAINLLPSVSSGDITVGGSYPNITYTFSIDSAPFSSYLTVDPLNLTGGTATIGHPSEVALAAGVDPEVSPYPAGVDQHRKLYVVYSVGNTIKLSFSPGGTPISGWTSSAYLLNNLKVYPANAGFFDSVQGRPQFFPNVDFTLSGISYVEVNLPAEMSEIEEDAPSKFKIYVRGRRLQNYTNTGQLANAQGVAYNPLALPPQTKFFSANNALVAMDIILNYMKVSKSRIDWASWVDFRFHCDQQIAWNSGTLQILANPSWTLDTGTTNPVLGTLIKTSGSGWNTGAVSVESTTSLQDMTVSGVWRGGHGAIGLTRATDPNVVSYFHAGMLYSIHPSILNGKLYVFEGNSNVPLFQEVLPFQDGDVFKIEVHENTVFFYKNDSVFFTTAAAFGAGTSRAFVAFDTTNASYSDVKFYPMAGGARTTNRFDAHNVFPQETDSSTALQQIFGRAVDCHWQDVDGKIKFIVGGTYADVTWGTTPGVSERVLCDIFSYDPLGSNYLIRDASKSTPENFARRGVATASSQQAGNFPATSTNNGNVATFGNWASGEGWASVAATVTETTPEWLVIDWKEKRPINSVTVYTLGDTLSYSTVSPADTFTLYGLQDYKVQYWNGTSWTTIRTVTGNNHIMSTSTFPVTMTDKIRILCTKGADGRARIIEAVAEGPAVIATVVPRSNIIADSFSSYKTPPEEKPNFLRLEVRDLDDPFYTKKYVYNSRDALIDQLGRTVDFGVVPLGVATQSLADRLGEATLRWNADLDLFINLKTFGSSYHVSKGDIVKVAHDITGWGLNNPGTFIVIEETLEPGIDTADEKTYLLQSYNPEYYSDTAHGAITANLPQQVSPLTPPPAPVSLTLSEENRVHPNGSSYTSIVGRVTFDTSHPYTQRARVYWKKALDIDFVATGIVLEQPNTSVTEIPFELLPAQVGINEVKVVTETLTGVVSADSITSVIDVTGIIQVEEVEWEAMVNTMALAGEVRKTAGTDAWDAGAQSTKAIALGEAYMQFTTTSESTGFTAGLTAYNKADVSHIGMKYGLLYSAAGGANVQVIIDGVSVTLDHAYRTPAAGQSFKIELTTTSVNFWQYPEVTDLPPILLKSVPNQYVYPLYVDVSIYYGLSVAPAMQLYGFFEKNTGDKVHWGSVRGVSISRASGLEVITKTLADGWAGLDSAGTYSLERLTKNGAVEILATETTTYRMIGLSEVDAEIANPAISGHLGVQFSWYMEVGGTASVRYFGTSLYTTTYVTGDILRIERIDGKIYFRKNGVLQIGLTTAPYITHAPLYIDSAFYSNGSTIKDVRLKRVGNFTPIPYTYPIYLVEDLYVRTNLPADDGSTYFELAGVFNTDGEAPIQRANVRLFDKFGNLVVTFPPFTYSGDGLLAWGYHDRKYADPLEEAIYEVRLDNGVGVSAPIYTKAGVETFVMPALLNPNVSAKDLVSSALDHNKISLTWNWNGNVDIWQRIQGTSAWGSAAVSNTATKPYIFTGLVPNTYYEFRVAPTGTTNYSNISRTKTLQAPLPAETSPPPLSLAGALNGAAPSTAVDLSWNRNSTTNTAVKLYQNGSLIWTGAATDVTKTVTGLTANTTYTFKVNNVYAGGDSIDSNVISITTGTVISASAPSGLAAEALSTSQVRLTWTNNTGAGSVNIYRSTNGTSYSLLATVGATQNSYNNTGLASSTNYWYKVENTTVTGFSNVASVVTWGTSENPCVVPDTLIWVLHNGKLAQTQARYVEEGDTVLTVRLGGDLAFTKVKKVKWGKSDTIYMITTESGRGLECTPSHPLVQNLAGDYEKAVNLGFGDDILSYSPSSNNVFADVIESKETLRGDFNVIIYELEGEDHTFVSNDIVSHNRKNDE